MVAMLLLYWSLSPPPTSDDASPRRKKSLVMKIWTKVEQTAANILDWMILKTQHWGRRQRGRSISPVLTGQRKDWSSKLLRLYVASVVAMAASSHANSVAESGPFDTDSDIVGIDNRCSGCITHVRSDIPGELQECRRIIGADLGNQTVPADATASQQKSARMSKPINRLIEVMQTEIAQSTAGNKIPGELFCLSVLTGFDSETEGDVNPILAFKAHTDPDTMYRHEAMREPDRDEFIKAMNKEINDQMKNGNFSIVRRSQVPKGKLILPAARSKRPEPKGPNIAPESNKPFIVCTQLQTNTVTTNPYLSNPKEPSLL